MMVMTDHDYNCPLSRKRSARLCRLCKAHSVPLAATGMILPLGGGGSVVVMQYKPEESRRVMGV